MSATATRPAPNALDQRRLGLAMGALIVAVALLVGATVVRQTSTQAPAVQAPVTTNFDRGSRDVWGKEKGFVYTGIPYAPTIESRPLNPGEIMVNNAADGLAGSGKGPRERLAQ